jgi:hypothetical protein
MREFHISEYLFEAFIGSGRSGLQLAVQGGWAPALDGNTTSPARLLSALLSYLAGRVNAAMLTSVSKPSSKEPHSAFTVL